MLTGIRRAAFAAALAAGQAAQAATTFVVLVDVSSSIAADDRLVYEESFANVRRAVRPGDRVVVSAVGKRDRANWKRDFDALAPKPVGRRFADEKARAEYEAAASKAFAEVLGRRPEPATRIVDSVEAASDAFSARPSDRKVLVLLSDMVETGKPGFASGGQPAAAAPRSLSGAKVFVAGAGGGADYGRIEAAWVRYFGSAPGAAIVQYGRYPADPR